MKILKNNFIFIIGIILLIYKALLLEYLLKIDIKANSIIYLTIVSLLIMCPTINNTKKSGYIYLNVIYTMITIIIYANFLYYSYSTNFLSLYQIENMQYAKEIKNGIVSIINIKSVLLFFIDNIIIAISSIILYKKIHKIQYRNIPLKVSLISIIIICNIFIVKEKINDIYISKNYNKSFIVSNASIYYYHYEDIKDYLKNILGRDNVDKEKIKTLYSKQIEQKTNNTEYTGVAKDCNVIIVQLESLNEYIIGKKINGKEITPNLNKFFSENIYCTDMYNQGLGSTADSEFEMENSMYPLENGYVFQKYYNNTWLDIYSTLKNKGYYTSFMHPNNSTYWNREEVYKNGYHIDEYNDINKFENIEVAGEFYSDEGFFEEAVNIMNTYENNFCTTLVSVTTHIPFYLTGVSNLEDKLTINKEDFYEYDNETFIDYLIACNFTDYAFGNFIKKLEETSLIENSILIVYGDHGAGITSVKDIQKLYEENEVAYTEFEDYIKDVHIPFGIKVPTIDSNENIRRTLSKIDIKPTILDLLNIEDNFSIGDTIFSEKNYSFIKGLGYVTSNNYFMNGKYYNRETLEEIDENEELLQLLNKMEDEIYLSDTIIKNNLYELIVNATS